MSTGKRKKNQRHSVVSPEQDTRTFMQLSKDVAVESVSLSQRDNPVFRKDKIVLIFNSFFYMLNKPTSKNAEILSLLKSLGDVMEYLTDNMLVEISSSSFCCQAIAQCVTMWRTVIECTTTPTVYLSHDSYHSALVCMLNLVERASVLKLLIDCLFKVNVLEKFFEDLAYCVHHDVTYFTQEMGLDVLCRCFIYLTRAGDKRSNTIADALPVCLHHCFQSVDTSLSLLKDMRVALNDVNRNSDKITSVHCKNIFFASPDNAWTTSTSATNYSLCSEKKCHANCWIDMNARSISFLQGKGPDERMIKIPYCDIRRIHFAEATNTMQVIVDSESVTQALSPTGIATTTVTPLTSVASCTTLKFELSSKQYWVTAKKVTERRLLDEEAIQLNLSGGKGSVVSTRGITPEYIQCVIRKETQWSAGPSASGAPAQRSLPTQAKAITKTTASTRPPLPNFDYGVDGNDPDEPYITDPSVEPTPPENDKPTVKPLSKSARKPIPTAPAVSAVKVAAKALDFVPVSSKTTPATGENHRLASKGRKFPLKSTAATAAGGDAEFEKITGHKLDLSDGGGDFLKPVTTSATTRRITKCYTARKAARVHKSEDKENMFPNSQASSVPSLTDVYDFDYGDVNEAQRSTPNHTKAAPAAPAGSVINRKTPLKRNPKVLKTPCKMRIATNDISNDGGKTNTTAENIANAAAKSAAPATVKTGVATYGSRADTSHTHGVSTSNVIPFSSIGSGGPVLRTPVARATPPKAKGRGTSVSKSTMKRRSTTMSAVDAAAETVTTNKNSKDKEAVSSFDVPADDLDVSGNVHYDGEYCPLLVNDDVCDGANTPIPKPTTNSTSLPSKYGATTAMYAMSAHTMASQSSPPVTVNGKEGVTEGHCCSGVCVTKSDAGTSPFASQEHMISTRNHHTHTSNSVHCTADDEALLEDGTGYSYDKYDGFQFDDTFGNSMPTMPNLDVSKGKATGGAKGLPGKQRERDMISYPPQDRYMGTSGGKKGDRKHSLSTSRYNSCMSLEDDEGYVSSDATNNDEYQPYEYPNTRNRKCSVGKSHDYRDQHYRDMDIGDSPTSSDSEDGNDKVIALLLQELLQMQSKRADRKKLDQMKKIVTDTQSQVSVFLNQWSDMELQEERKLCVDWEVKVQTMWDKTDQLYKTLTAFLETHRKEDAAAEEYMVELSTQVRLLEGGLVTATKDIKAEENRLAAALNKRKAATLENIRKSSKKTKTNGHSKSPFDNIENIPAGICANAHHARGSTSSTVLKSLRAL